MFFMVNDLLAWRDIIKFNFYIVSILMGIFFFLSCPAGECIRADKISWSAQPSFVGKLRDRCSIEETQNWQVLDKLENNVSSI